MLLFDFKNRIVAKSWLLATKTYVGKPEAYKTCWMKLEESLYGRYGDHCWQFLNDSAEERSKELSCLNCRPSSKVIPFGSFRHAFGCPYILIALTCIALT
eukprot:c19549_g1_i1 orf=866-1165(+)